MNATAVACLGESPRPLTLKQRRFVDELLVDFNATAAAVRAGYSPRSAYSIGSENLRKPEIRAAIIERIEDFAMPTIEVLARLSAGARGEVPTRVVVGRGGVREIYDVHAPLAALARILGIVG